jgi:Flp pilus assembly protein CpaB
VTQSPSLAKREAGTSPNGARSPRRRPAASHLLVALAVVLAFVLNVLALQGRGDAVMVAVADGPIAAGERLMPGMVRMVPVGSDFAGLPSLVNEEGLTSLTGWVVLRGIDDGGLLERGNLARPATNAGLRAMSIPVPVARAAGGTVVPGDRVDLIAVRDGEARYVVKSVAVLSVASTGSGFSTVDYHLVVAVDDAEALLVAEAVATGPVDVIRSTGADPWASDEP